MILFSMTIPFIPRQTHQNSRRHAYLFPTGLATADGTCAWYKWLVIYLFYFGPLGAMCLSVYVFVVVNVGLCFHSRQISRDQIKSIERTLAKTIF